MQVRPCRIQLRFKTQTHVQCTAFAINQVVPANTCAANELLRDARLKGAPTVAAPQNIAAGAVNNAALGGLNPGVGYSASDVSKIVAGAGMPFTNPAMASSYNAGANVYQAAAQLSKPMPVAKSGVQSIGDVNPNTASYQPVSGSFGGG